LTNNSKFKIQNSKLINAWAFYDWANSVYPLVITSTIFPIYYNSVTSSNGSDVVHFLGFDFVNTALYSYALSFSFLIATILSPILSGIADFKGNKKSFMQFFCYLGAVSCSLMYFFDGTNLWLGLLTMMLASIGFSGSLIFYNAYLPEITVSEKYDEVSARGFAMGYIGSSLLLIFNLTMVMKPEWYGITVDSLPAKISFVLVGIWWMGFAQVTFHYLPKVERTTASDVNVLSKGFSELKGVWEKVRTQVNLKVFLFSYFFYNMGVQTVMYAAVLFGDKELQLESGQLITSILIIQFVAIAGAYLFSAFSKQVGNIKALILAVMIWVVICVGAYFVYSAIGFYVLAFVVGMVMGGIQSLSRSTYSKLLPQKGEHNSYFSFYDIIEKMAIVIGMASFGFIEDMTGSMRNSIIALIIFFVLGLISLFRLRNLEFVKSSITIQSHDV